MGRRARGEGAATLFYLYMQINSYSDGETSIINVVIDTIIWFLRFVFWVPNIGICDHNEEWDTY